MGTVDNHRDKLHVAYKSHTADKWQVLDRLHVASIKTQTTASCSESSQVNPRLSATSGRGMKAHSENNSGFLTKLGSQDSCFVGVFSQALRNLI